MLFRSILAKRAMIALNLPNILTYSRIVAVPVIAATFFISGDVGRWLSLFLFAAAAVTDYFDGVIARAWSQQSAIGRMLDPIADKALVSVSLFVLVADGTIGGWSFWAAVIILMREVLVSGLREFLADLRVSVPVSRLAKWKTATQLIAIGFLLAGPAGDKVLPGTTMAGLVLLWGAAVVTLYTGYDYFRAGLVHLIDEERVP
jgi:cardiolipin synthase